MSLPMVAAHAQQTQGRVLYERTLQVRIDMEGMGAEAAQMAPRTSKSKLEVLFAGNRSLRRAVPEEAPDDFGEEGGGLRLRMTDDPADELAYADFSTGRTVEQQEFAAKNYVITDSIHRLHWKLTEDTLTILGYPCRKAVSQRIVQHHKMTDTMDVAAWFTMAVPVPAGPECEGQLPGLILALDFGNGRAVYKALEVSPAVELREIKAPSRGKKLSMAEFVKERDKIMSDMQRRNGGAPLRIGG